MALKNYPPLHTAKGSQQTDMPWPQLDWPNGQVMTLGSTSAQSSIYTPQQDTVWRLVTNQSCWYAVGPNPTAQSGAAGSSYLPANIEPIFEYVPANNKIAALTTAASGTLVMIPALVIG